MTRHPYREWQRPRGKLDRIKQVTVLDGAPDIAAHIIERWQTMP